MRGMKYEIQVLPKFHISYFIPHTSIRKGRIDMDFIKAVLNYRE